MNHVKVLVCLIICFSGYGVSVSQTTCTEFPVSSDLAYNTWNADADVELYFHGFISQKERKIEKGQVVIDLADHIQLIECVPEYIFGGEVRTEYNQGIKDVQIEFSTPGQVYPKYLTGTDGEYIFSNVIVNGEATISAYRNDFPRNGVSTLDLVLIQKHLLGKDILDSPYQYIAADANNSQNVSAIDLIELRKLILGIYTELPNNLSWRFVPADYVFQDPIDPWTDTIVPWPQGGRGTITITDPDNPGNLDFIGIKIGDVNGTAKPNFTQVHPRNSLTPFELKTDQQSYQAGDMIYVPFRISSDQKLIGFQFTLNAAGMKILNVIPGQVSVSEADYAFFNDKMTISWFDENNVEVSSGDILFTIQLRANQSGDLSHSLSINSSITEAELYVDGVQTFVPELRIDQRGGKDELAILSCSPNPWKDETMISFYLLQSDRVTYTLRDMNGRRIKSYAENLGEGYQAYTLKATDFQERGMIFLEIRAGQYSAVQKMIVLDE